MDEITECIDDMSTFFSWADDRASFCALLDTGGPDWNQRKQAKRQYAALLANVCVGDLEILANNGDTVSLPLDTPISGICLGWDVDTVGEVIAYVDARMAELEAMPLEDAKTFYGAFSCLDAINNGDGIPYDPEACKAVNPDGGRDVPVIQSGSDAESNIPLYVPVPNPFSRTTRIAYLVGGESGEYVDIGVYDAAGRRVRNLTGEFQSAGKHEVLWDGRDEQGQKVPASIYFYRLRIGEREEVIRTLLMK
jgi:hypothetical protein